MDLVKKHVLMIDSRFRSSGTHEDFVHHLNENDFHSCRYVQLKDITFNNTIYNITTANNVLNWFTTINNTLTIPVGYYTADELLTYINSNSALVFVNNTKLRKFVVSSSTAFYILATSTILNVIGFQVPIQTLLSSHTGTQLYNFITTRHIHVISNSLSEPDSFVANNGKKYAVIATIPVISPFGGVINITEEKTSADDSYHNANINLSSIDIRLVDNNFETINLNGSNIIMNFTIKKN